MSKNVFCLALCAMLFALCSSGEVQQAKKVLGIGYLSSVDPATDSPRGEGIRRALRDLGYICRGSEIGWQIWLIWNGVPRSTWTRF